MSSSRVLAAIATAAAIAVATTGASVGASGPWSQVPSPNSPGSNELLGAAASSPDQAWAVGRVLDSRTRTYRSLLLRFDGTAWAAATHPRPGTNNLLAAVDAPADNDAWAVGYRQTTAGGWRTLVERWDGAAWNVIPSPNPNPNGTNQLTGVKAVPGAPGTAWAVGAYSRPDGSFGRLKLIAQRVGGTWRTFSTPPVTPEDFLEAVDATGSNHAWTVGWGSTSPFGGTAVPIALRWNGSTWSAVPLPEPNRVMLFGVEAIAPDDVWAVGHTYPGGPHWIPAIWHFDGTSWTRATIPAFPSGGQLRDIVAVSPTDVYAVGLDGEGFNARSLVLHWDGSAWTRETTPSPPGGPKLYGAAAAGSSVWGVGYRYDQARSANRTFIVSRP